jgi:diguanylate cyclase (GGDEF)-like protein
MKPTSLRHDRLMEQRVFQSMSEPEYHHKLAVLSCSVAVVCLTSLLSYYTGDFSLVILNVFAILLASWFAGRWPGLAIAVLSGMGINLSYYLLGKSQASVHYLNMSLEVVVMAVISLLTSSFREHHVKVKYMATYDQLTGVSNRNSFFILAEQLLIQAKRYNRPFTLAFIDLDNFKLVNDRHGHHEGDRVLVTVAAIMQASLRHADIVARIGGDEFVVLLPETDYKMAGSALQKLRTTLVNEMRSHGWPVTFSIGAVSCRHFDGTVDELLKLADRYLYKVKAGSKDGIYHEEI